MITRERYAELLENVLEKYDRYRAMYPRGATIVFVVSPKILTAIKAYEAGNRDSLYDTYMEPYNMEQFLKLLMCILFTRTMKKFSHRHLCGMMGRVK